MRLPAICFGVLIISVSGAPAPGQNEPVITVTLATSQKTGPTGQATLSQRGNDVLVTVEVPNDAQDSMVAVNQGACKSQPSGKAQYTLGKLENGAIQSIMKNTTIASLTQQPNAIVVEQTPLLCGDINAASPLPGSQPASPKPGQTSIT